MIIDAGALFASRAALSTDPTGWHIACRYAVRVMREGPAWLVVVRSHGWLHGDERGALDDAAWLSQNFGLPIRRDDPEDST
jgi:hypothetical protein